MRDHGVPPVFFPYHFPCACAFPSPNLPGDIFDASSHHAYRELPSSVSSTNRYLLLLIPVPPTPALIQMPLTWTIVTNQNA